MSQASPYFGEILPSAFLHSPSASTTARVRADSEPAKQLKYQGLSHQQRLLLLRASGFRGISLLAGDISCRTPIGSPRAERQIDGEDDEQTTPRGVGRERRCTDEATGNPLGILEEISNSAARRREASWTDILCNQDQISTCSVDDDENTPPARRGGPSKDAKMRSRGGSLTPQTPSPIAKHTKRRQRRSPNLRSSYLESAQYIEHLESQLVALQTQLQSLTSPTTIKTHSAKLRALTTESRLLRQELSEWETRFNERVREEVDGRVELEASLRARIKTLERELDIKDGKVRELQWELETFEGKARAVGTIEAENISLGRRVDLLTELLAQSPTKLTAEPSPSPSTPGQRKKARPRSMFPRMASSESACATPLSVQAQIDSKRDSVRSTSTASTFSQSHWSDDYEDLLHYPSKRNRVSTDLESIFSGLSAASSLASTQPSLSRPTSVISDTSINPGNWGLSVPSPLCRDKQYRHNRHRKMRRFPSGSSAPKSLILPTTSHITPLPALAPVGGPSDFVYERLLARESISARLSSVGSLSLGTTRHGYRSTPTWAEKETLKVLEANSTSSRLHADAAKFNESPSPSPQPLRHQESEAGSLQGTPAQRESLFAEMSRAEEGRLHSTLGAETPQETFGSMGAYVSPHDQVCTSMNVRNQTALEKRPALPVSVAGLGGFLWKLSAVLGEVWQNPIKIARKVISVGWSAGKSKAAGELDWWLLGLLLRPIGLKGGKPTDAKQSALNERGIGNGFDWRDFSVEASKARRLNNLVGGGSGDESLSGGSKSGSAGCGDIENTGGAGVSLTVSAASPASLETVRCPDSLVGEPSRQKVLLWIEFIVALVLAVGVAVKDGPASVLPSCATADVGVMTDHQQGTESPQGNDGEDAVDVSLFMKGGSAGVDSLESGHDL